MPEFRLELPDRDPKSKIIKYLYVAKKTFSPNVYVNGWCDHLESLPIDNDPFEEGKVNHHLSHYDSLGIEKCMEYRTTTKDMLEQINRKDLNVTTSQRNALINLLTFDDSTHCEDDSTRCCNDTCYQYTTTMQDSYKMPYPYAMKRLALPKTPHMLYRKMTNEDVLNGEKFMDDGFVQRTRGRICAKKSQFVSYDPLTGLNTDGTQPKGDKIRSCYILDY